MTPNERMTGLWWASGLLLVLVVPSQLWLGQPVWSGSADQLLQSFALGAAYVCASMIAITLSGHVRSTLLSSLVGVVFAFGLAYAVLDIWLGEAFSRGVAGITFALTVGVILLGLKISARVLLTGSGLMLATALLVFVQGYSAAPAPPPAIQTLLQHSAHHRYRLTYYNRVLSDAQEYRGGSFDRLGTDYVRMTGAGAFYRIRFLSRDSIIADSLSIPSPVNADAFLAAAPAVKHNNYRALDFVWSDTGEGPRIFVAHHYWHTDRSCFTVRVSTLPLDAQLRPREPAAWQPLFESKPCLPLTDASSRIEPGITLESGGRLAWLRPGQLLVTVGDHGFDGWNRSFVAAQSDTSDYGRTILLDVATGVAETFTLGHRNPQGLHVDEQGRVWSTEHGPQGGDELNLLVRGRNYGWPYDTEGTDYGRRSWPLRDAARGDFEKPVTAWVPSVGISQVISVPASSFSRWGGDLIVASLRGHSIYRVAIADGRAIYTETLPINRRIRDIAVGPDGALWLWTDSGDLVSVSAAAAGERGEELFAQCAACHLTEYNTVSGPQAPSLRGIVGRDIAAMRDFPYSPALRSIRGRWTVEQLAAFISDPAGFAPGTTMAFPGMSNPDDVAALVEYLRELRQ